MRAVELRTDVGYREYMKTAVAVELRTLESAAFIDAARFTAEFPSMHITALMNVGFRLDRAVYGDRYRLPTERQRPGACALVIASHPRFAGADELISLDVARKMELDYNNFEFLDPQLGPSLNTVDHELEACIDAAVLLGRALADDVVTNPDYTDRRRLSIRRAREIAAAELVDQMAERLILDRLVGRAATLPGDGPDEKAAYLFYVVVLILCFRAAALGYAVFPAMRESHRDACIRRAERSGGPRGG